MPDVQQPTTWVAQEEEMVVRKDHNFYEDPELSSSSPTVPQIMVLVLLAYMMDRQMMVNTGDFNIPSDPG